MDKDKCIVPSVVSLHVRNIDEKEPLKSLFNCSENSNNRRMSYNLVRIYNTGYNSKNNKPVSENLPPYLANIAAQTHSFNSDAIDCRFNALLKRANPEYPSLFPNNKTQLVSQFWSNSMRNHQAEDCFISKKCPSPSSDSDSQKGHNNPTNSKVASGSVSNSILKQNTLPKKRPNVCVRLEQLQEDSLYLPTNSMISKSKPIEIQEKPHPLNVVLEEQFTEIRASSIRNPTNKYQNITDKPSNRKPTPSVLLPIKERATTANPEPFMTSQSRSQTSLSKSSINTVPKSVTPSPAISDTNKVNETTVKRNNSPLLTRLINTQSNFMSNTHSFPYSDPCDGEGSAILLSRLNELSALESETVRWEKTKTVKRRPRAQIESM